MTTKEIKQMVDEGAQLVAAIKEADAKLKLIKSQLKAHAMKEGIKSVPGIEHVLIISPSPSSSVDPAELRKLMMKLKMGDQFFDCVKVGLTETRKIVPAHELAKIETKTVDDYGKMTFK